MYKNNKCFLLVATLCFYRRDDLSIKRTWSLTSSNIRQLTKLINQWTRICKKICVRTIKIIAYMKEKEKEYHWKGNLNQKLLILVIQITKKKMKLESLTFQTRNHKKQYVLVFFEPIDFT